MATALPPHKVQYILCKLRIHGVREQATQSRAQDKNQREALAGDS